MKIKQITPFQSKPNEVAEAVEHAIDGGYRHIDTAFVYGNEKEVGQAIKKKIVEGLVKREDIFLVTKVIKIFRFLNILPKIIIYVYM